MNERDELFLFHSYFEQQMHTLFCIELDPRYLKLTLNIKREYFSSLSKIN